MMSTCPIYADSQGRRAWRSTPLGDHFKTGHRGSLQNRPTDHHPGRTCFTLPAGGLASPVLTSPVPHRRPLRCRLSYQPDVLQDHIPVLPFLRREVSFENQVTSSRSTGDTRYRLTNYLHHLASCIIGVECRYDFGPCR